MSKHELELAEALKHLVDVVKRADPELYPDRSQAPDDAEWDAAITEAEAVLAQHQTAEAA